MKPEGTCLGFKQALAVVAGDLNDCFLTAGLK